MAEFKSGDVVLLTFLGYKNGEDVELVGIVGTENPHFGMVNISALYENNEWALNLKGAWEIEYTRHHPNPDPVWGDYCAALLTDTN